MDQFHTIIQVLSRFIEGLKEDLYQVARRAVRDELAEFDRMGFEDPGVRRQALSLRESAEYTGLSESTLRRRAREGCLSIQKSGARAYIRLDELNRFLAAGDENLAH